MTKVTQRLLFIAGLVALLAGPAMAEEDFGGCKDHPLFSRMPNHFIYGCDHSQFEMRRFPVGPMNKEGKAKLQEVEGEFWTLQYVINDGATKASGLQIQRNFQNAAKRAGGTVEGSYPEWCTFNLDTFARIFIQRLPLMLERRIHRWRLHYRADKLAHHAFDIGTAYGYRPLRQNLTIGITSIGGFSKLDHGLIGFIRIRGILGKLGGFTKT